KSVIQSLIDGRKVQADRDALRLAAHLPSLSDADAAAKDRLEDKIKSSGLQAGTLDEAAASAGVSLDLARKLYNLLTAERKVLRIDDMVYHCEVVEKLKESVRARKAVGPRIDVALFKEMTGGLSRKHAIPLLEYLDRERVTRRVGNEREIL
ncbi:MAG: SelB C-terminal domain-containing protein, partial [Blastocatellia bacterium]